MKTTKIITKNRDVGGVVDVEVDAYIVGDLAVHRPISSETLKPIMKTSAAWTITHVASGKSITPSKGYRPKTLRVALRIAKAIQERLSFLNWSSENPLAESKLGQSVWQHIDQIFRDNWNLDDANRAQRLQDRINEVKKLQTVKFK